MQNIPKLTVADLRKRGHKVRVIHTRRYKIPTKIFTMNVPRKEKPKAIEVTPVLLSKGGETKIEVDLKNGRYYYSTSVCSKKEYYNKKSAVSITLGRIIKQIVQDGQVDSL